MEKVTEILVKINEVYNIENYDERQIEFRKLKMGVINDENLDYTTSSALVSIMNKVINSSISSL